MERMERRETPQIPWPLVHPPLILVPKPTNNPATIDIGIESVLIDSCTVCGIHKTATMDPNTKPTRKSHRQCSLGFVINDEKIPLNPQIFPTVSISKDTESPIMNPPAKAFSNEDPNISKISPFSKQPWGQASHHAHSLPVDRRIYPIKIQQLQWYRSAQTDAIHFFHRRSNPLDDFAYAWSHELQ